jgi:hypothetical protein
MKQSWRNDLPLALNESINNLIKETKEYSYAINNAKDRSKAQLWVALALINNKLNNRKDSDNITESLNQKEYKKKIPKEEMDTILKTLETL